MKFCPECGTIIQPTKEDGKTILDCSNCEYTNQEDKSQKMSFSEKGKKKKDVEIIEDDTEQTKPIIDRECPECGNNKAYYWTIQTRAGDEPETRFYRCTECKHTVREY